MLHEGRTEVEGYSEKGLNRKNVIFTVRNADQLQKTVTNIFSMEMNGTFLMPRSCEILAATYMFQCG